MNQRLSKSRSLYSNEISFSVQLVAISVSMAGAVRPIGIIGAATESGSYCCTAISAATLASARAAL